MPWGQRLAIDASMVKEPTKNNRLLNVVTVAFVIQVLSVYFFSALLKTGSAWVEDGTAIYYALHNDLFALNLSHYWRDIDWLTHGLTRFCVVVRACWAPAGVEPTVFCALAYFNGARFYCYGSRVYFQSDALGYFPISP